MDRYAPSRTATNDYGGEYNWGSGDTDGLAGTPSTSTATTRNIGVP
jgi:hypothetical protein